MRLLTHNYLQSNVRGTEKGYPLIIEATNVVVEESPVNRDMIHAILPKLDYSALVSASRQLAATASAAPKAEQEDEKGSGSGSGTSSSEAETGSKSLAGVVVPDLPDQVPDMPLDDDTITKLHRVLLDIHVLGGHLVCPDTGRRFPINDGIPNMVLHEDEL